MHAPPLETLFPATDTSPLTVNLTKRLLCNHERTDFAPVKVGDSVHCWMCRGLREVVAVTFPPNQCVTNFDRDRLKLAGYTANDIKRMELGREVAR